MPLIFDKLVKAPLFDCRECGQCLLSETNYICPMTCPKGLRNGPCGGTLNGQCEVIPEMRCVWLRITDRGYDPDGVYPPFEPQLVGTSSLANYLTGRDKPTRQPRSYEPHQCEDSGLPSELARRFERPGPVITLEIASPRDRSGLDRVASIVRRVNTRVDGINTTTNAGGVASLHSLETARTVAANGVPPIVQFCGRDQDAGAFREQLSRALADGFANILALTGDWDPEVERAARAESWFPMDSLQMVDILARSTGFDKRPFIGVASTAYTTPMSASLARFRQKFAAGADFTQTQVVTETAVFSAWLDAVRSTEPGRRAKILASVPLVGKPRPYEILRNLPGVIVSDDFRGTLEQDGDLAANGILAARALIRRLLDLDIDGVHLLNFGMPVSAIVDLVDEIRELSSSSAA